MTRWLTIAAGAMLGFGAGLQWLEDMLADGRAFLGELLWTVPHHFPLS